MAGYDHEVVTDLVSRFVCMSVEAQVHAARLVLAPMVPEGGQRIRDWTTRLANVTKAERVNVLFGVIAAMQLAMSELVMEQAQEARDEGEI